MEDLRKKIPVHLGLFGHIDSGKTAVASVLSEIISTAGIDAHPQSKERGITIDLGFTSFILDDYLITLVDGPGHADLIKISASSVDIIDCALIVIDINKGPQVQTGEHLIMIESLGIKDIIVILNKIDLFKGDIKEEIKKIQEFFKSTSFGGKIPIILVSAKEKKGFEELKKSVLNKIKALEIKRDTTGALIMPIDHYFLIKGRGIVITGTILKGSIKINDKIEIIPNDMVGRVKSIQIFHQDVDKAKAGDRVGINIKGVDIKKIFRGCYATTDKKSFNQAEIIEIKVKKNSLFKPKTYFGMQVHVTIGMFSTVGYIYPYKMLNGKKIQLDVIDKETEFYAFIWLKEKILTYLRKTKILISRLDLPPTTLRILGSAEILNTVEGPPILYRFKIKKGIIQNPNHPQGIICTGLAQSLIGAKKIIGKKLEPPFTEILGHFGTKGAVIIGLSPDSKKKGLKIEKGDQVILKELRSFKLKRKKDLYS